MSARGRLLRRLRPGSEAGLSLVELLVSIMITGIVMTIVGTMFVNVARVTANSNATTTRSSVAANVMDELSKVIRTAANNAVASSDDADPAIVSGTAATVTLYSFVDASPLSPAPTKVGLRVDARGNLIEDRWTATVSAGYWVFTGSATSRAVGGPVQTPTGASALFVYLDDTGAVLSPGTSGLSLAQRSEVASIRVTVTIANQSTTGSDPIIIVNTIGMPNVNLSRTDG